MLKIAFRQIAFAALGVAALIPVSIGSVRGQTPAEISANLDAMHRCGMCLQKITGLTKQDAKDKAEHPVITVGKDLASCTDPKGCLMKLAGQTTVLLFGKACLEGAAGKQMLAAKTARIKSDCEVPDSGGMVRTLTMCRDGYGVSQVAPTCSPPHAGTPTSSAACTNLHCPSSNGPGC